MSKRRVILLRIVLMISVIACFGLNTILHQYSSFDSAPNTSNSNDIVNVVTNDIDSFDEDHLNQLFIANPILKTINLVIPQIDNKLIIKRPLLIWQPPKTC